MHAPMDIAEFAEKAGQVADTLKAIGNQRRLMVLCKLVEHGEMKVGDLAQEVDLSQSALSQHLSKMREEGLIAYRREAQVLRSRLADHRIEQLLPILYDLYCKD